MKTPNRMSTQKEYYNWPTRLGITVSFGAWSTGLLWLITRNAWAGVLILGLCLGFKVMQNCMLADEIHKLNTEKGMELHQLEDENQRLKMMVVELQDTCRLKVGKKGRSKRNARHSTLYRHTAADDLDGV